MSNKTKNLIKRNNVYYIRYMQSGKQIMKSLATSKEREAIKKRDEILHSVKDLKTETDVIQKVARARKIYNPKQFPVSTLLHKFSKELVRNGASPDSLKRNQYKWSCFEKWLAANYPEINSLHEIVGDIAKKYADVLLDTGISHKVYNETLNLLFRALDTFKADAEIINNPFDRKYITRRNKNVISRKEFNREETLRILESISGLHVPFAEEFELLFHIGTWSGMRLKDAVLLKWADVDFDTDLIYITPFKTRKHNIKVKIPIHPLLKIKLHESKNQQIDDIVLPNLAEKYSANPEYVSRYIRTILEHNGFKNTPTENRLKTPCLYGFHSLRYTFISECARAGLPMSLVQEIVGHMSPNMTRHYTRYDDQFRQKSIKKISFGIESDSTEVKNRIIAKLDKFPLEQLKSILQHINSRGVGNE